MIQSIITFAEVASRVSGADSSSGYFRRYRGCCQSQKKKKKKFQQRNWSKVVHTGTELAK